MVDSLWKDLQNWKQKGINYIYFTPQDKDDIETLPILVQFDREADLDKLLANVIKPQADG